MRVSPAQLSVLRMIPIARRLASVGRGELAVLRLLNSYRGWDTQHTPVADVRRALAIVREQYGDLPVGLVGHSLGGRAAILAGDDPSVRLVVALNPWVYPTDRADLSGRRVVIAHGDADRIASISRAMAVARTLQTVADVSFEVIRGGRHAMLRHHRLFDRVTVDAVTATLLRRPADQRVAPGT